MAVCSSVEFESDDIARAGVFISIAHDGSLDIDRGYVRVEDEAPIGRRSAR
jgi:ParB family chromosome partitioning protein